MTLEQMYEPTQDSDGEPLTVERRVEIAEAMLEAHDDLITSGNEHTGDPWATRLHRALVDLHHYAWRQGMTGQELAAMIASAAATAQGHNVAEGSF